MLGLLPVWKIEYAEAIQPLPSLIRTHQKSLLFVGLRTCRFRSPRGVSGRDDWPAIIKFVWHVPRNLGKSHGPHRKKNLETTSLGKLLLALSANVIGWPHDACFCSDLQLNILSIQTHLAVRSSSPHLAHHCQGALLSCFPRREERHWL
jgi:hypothetical protein